MQTKDVETPKRTLRLRTGCLVACGVVVALLISFPAIVRAVFRWDFSRRAIAYEDSYRRRGGTCYRQWDFEPESAWFLTMTEEDYARCLRDLADSPDGDVSYWARRTLVNGYPHSPEAKALVFSWIDNPAQDPELRMSAALTLADWRDGSRLARQIEVFESAPEGNGRYWLGLHLASVGARASLCYALALLGRRPDLAGEICPRLGVCMSASPGALDAVRGSEEPDILRGLEEFNRWLASPKRKR